MLQKLVALHLIVLVCMTVGRAAWAAFTLSNTSSSRKSSQVCLPRPGLVGQHACTHRSLVC